MVAPAYIGRGTRIAAQCLVTRGSSVESNCQVDYGTVVEDSSILSNSYVGIGLDLSHSVVDGNNLLNLERKIVVDFGDRGSLCDPAKQNFAQREEPAVPDRFWTSGRSVCTSRRRFGLKMYWSNAEVLKFAVER